MGPLSIIRRREWKRRDPRAALGSAALADKAQPTQFLLEPWCKVAAVEREREVGGEKPEPGAAVEGPTVESRAMKGLGAGELDHAVGQLNLAARALFDRFEDLKNLRLENIASRNDEIGGRGPLLRLFDHFGDLEGRAMVGADPDNSVLMGFGGRNLFDRDDVAAVPFICRDALGKAAPAARSASGDHVREQDRERFRTHEFARAPDGVPEAERRLLAGEAGRAGGGKIGHQRGVFALFAAPLEGVFEFIGRVEMIFDDAFVPAGHEDEMLDTRLARFVDDVLKNRPVDESQHLFGDRLGRWKEPGAETGDGQHGFADGFVHGCSVPRSARWKEASPANS